MQQITIKIVYDNCKACEGFQEGWGFSCVVDLGHRKILFDTGADSQAFFSNFHKLGLNLEDITDVVYSHRHYDHVAGLEEVMTRLKKGSRLFLPKRFPSKKIPTDIAVEPVKGLKEIDQGVYCLSLKGGLFFYEQALLVETSQGIVVITGCAHPGIVKILKETQKRLKQPIHLVLGGFHLFRKKEDHILDIVDQVKALKVQKVAPCHCSGPLAIQKFGEAFQGSSYEVGTGSVLTLEK